MRVFICRKHNGIWSDGCSVIVADSEGDAKRILFKELQKRGIKEDARKIKLEQVYLLVEKAYVINDGSP